MASLNLSAVIIPGATRKETLGAANKVRLVTLPTNLQGVKGGGLSVSVYPVATDAYWISADTTTPTENDTHTVASSTDVGILPADTWSIIPWDPGRGDPASLPLVSEAASQVVHLVVSPARVPG